MAIGQAGWKNAVTDVERFISAGAAHNRFFYNGMEDAPYFLALRCEANYLEAFNICPPLKAIVGKKAKAFNTGVRLVKNKKSGKKGSGEEAAALRKILDKPNPLQNGLQFFAQQNHYIDLFGYCPILVMRPTGMPWEISAVWNIPPWLFDLEYTGKWLFETSKVDIYKKFIVNWGGKQMPIDVEALRFVFDDGIGTECDTNLTIPDSRLVGLEYPVSNIVAAYKSRNTLITKRGAIGILSNEDKNIATGKALPIDDDVKNALQKDFGKYGLTGQPYQIIVTDASLKWQQMGFPTKELMLFEEIQEDIERLCDAFGWPVELIARGKDVTYDNKKQARKDLYHNTIIPEADSRMEQFSRAVVTLESNLEIVCDYSSVQVLQEDKKEAAETRKAIDDACEREYNNGLITKNDWRIALGLEPLPDEQYNIYKNETATPENTSPPAEE
jgi:hypothetical protein